MRVRDYRFAVDCYSHVRLHLQFHITTILWNQVLKNFASIAIWNRNKAAVALAIIVWGTNIGFHIYSKSLPLIPSAEDLKCHTNAIR